VLTADVKIFWHPQGDYLAVKVDRFTKTKKSTYTGFELFSIREKDIPMDVSAACYVNMRLLL
jgi:translation initiation factor 3 subunit B